jgi:hypothetical protein
VRDWQQVSGHDGHRQNASAEAQQTKVDRQRWPDEATIFTDAKAKQAAKAKTMAVTQEGNVSKPWVDEALKRLGCEGV